MFNFQMLNRTFVFKYVLGCIGIVSILPIIPHLLSLQPEAAQVPIAQAQIATFIQSALMLLVLMLLGIKANRFLGHDATSILSKWFGDKSKLEVDVKVLLYKSMLAGVLSGAVIVLLLSLLIDLLPTQFLVNSDKLVLPLYAKLLYGGITEELLIRFGLLSVIAALSYRVLQKGQGKANHIHYVIAIMLSSLLFAAGHLPIAFLLAGGFDATVFIYVMLGNGVFSVVAGYLYWKNGLESAVIAHMFAHLSMSILA